MLRTLALLLLISGTAMARDGTIQAPQNGGATIDDEEEFWNSPLGQDMMKNFEDFQSGKKTGDQIQKELEEKYGSGGVSPRMVPNAPIVKVR